MSRSRFRTRLSDLLADAPADGEVITVDDTWWTWGDLAGLSRRFDAVLDGLGLGPGARVGLVLENRPQHLGVVLAALAGDRCVVTLSPLQPPDRLAADIRRSAAPVVVASAEVLARDGVAAAVAEAGLAVTVAADGTFTVSGAGGTGDPEDASAPGVAVEMFTSGTTGPPKRIRLTDAQFDASLASAAVPARTDGGRAALGTGVSIISTPLVHIGGLWNGLAALYSGRRIVLQERFRLPDWVDTIARYRPRTAGLVPAAMRAVLDADVDPEQLSSLVAVISGTAPCPVDLAEEFTRRFGAAVLMTYGATEFAGAVAGWTYPLHREWWDRKKGSTGRAFPGIELRVVDDGGALVAPGEPGRLEVLAAQAAGGDGQWTRTSDLARIDEDGFVWILGRADDAIIRGGFKVHPEAVRAVLERHPAVAEASVAGRPDERLGAVPVAAVETRPGAVAPTPEELTALCREHLTPYEVPVEVVVVDALPRTAALKVDRVEMLRLFDDRVPA